MKKSVKPRIVELLSKKFEEPEFESLFLIDVTSNEKSAFVRVYIDGDQGVKFSDCQQISRYLESFLDEDDEISDAYTLEVSSPGVKRPLVQLRQYAQHVGRTLKITLLDSTTKTLKLLSVEDQVLKLETIPGKKKKDKKIELVDLRFDEIKEAIVKISFNK